MEVTSDDRESKFFWLPPQMENTDSVGLTASNLLLKQETQENIERKFKTA